MYLTKKVKDLYTETTSLWRKKQLKKKTQTNGKNSIFMDQTNKYC